MGRYISEAVRRRVRDASVDAEIVRSGHAQNRSIAVVTAHRLAILRGSARVGLEAPNSPMTPFWAVVIAATARLHASMHGLPPPSCPTAAS
jgi:hypothetical protein